MSERLSRPARWLLSSVVPNEWRTAVEGDLLEERQRRAREERRCGPWWQTSAVIMIGTFLWLDRVRDRHPSPAGRRPRRTGALWTDIKYAARGLARQPAYVAVVVFTLALGIGANAAVYTVANALVFRPIPGVGHPSGLVGIQLRTADGTSGSPLPIVDIEMLQHAAPALEGVAGVDNLSTTNLRVGTEPPRRVDVEVVTAGLFDIIDAPLLTGRAFTRQETDDPSAAPVIIISDRLRQAEFPAGHDVIGTTVVVNGQRATIVGVAPHGFEGLRLFGNIDLWLPAAQRTLALGSGSRKEAAAAFRRTPAFFSLVGRLAPGQTVDALQRQLPGAEGLLVTQHSASGGASAEHLQVTSNFDLLRHQRQTLITAFDLLLVLSGFLFVLACTNVSNTVAARSASRTHEIATRLALGASRWAVGRIFLIEAVLLSVTAGVVAIGLGLAAGRALNGVVILPRLPSVGSIAPDWRVILWSIALSVTAAVATTLLPVTSVRRTDLHLALRRARDGRRAGKRLSRVLTACQVTVSVVLLIGAALLTRAIGAVLTVSPGFDAARVLTFSITPNLAPGQSSFALQQALQTRLRATPGVRAASIAFLPPFYNGNEARLPFRTRDEPDQKMVARNSVRTGFFDALGVPFVAGRDFTDTELNSSEPTTHGPLIFTEAVARRTFGGASAAVGQTVRVTTISGPVDRVIVGVVRDTRERMLLDSNTSDIAFEPYRADNHTPWITAIVGISAPPDAVWPGLRKALADVAPDLPMFGAMSVDEGIRTEFGDDVLVTRLTLLFALLAVAVAACGLGSVLARTVAEHRREFGIRAALGATPGDAARMITREAAMSLMIGVAAGTLASVWLTRFLAARLYGISRFDAVSFAAAIGCAASLMLLATIPAARGASRLDPSVALREPVEP